MSRNMFSIYILSSWEYFFHSFVRSFCYIFIICALCLTRLFVPSTSFFLSFVHFILAAGVCASNSDADDDELVEKLFRPLYTGLLLLWLLWCFLLSWLYVYVCLCVVYERYQTFYVCKRIKMKESFSICCSFSTLCLFSSCVPGCWFERGVERSSKTLCVCVWSRIGSKRKQKKRKTKNKGKRMKKKVKLFCGIKRKF